MKVFRGLESLEKLKKPIVTTGTFDGVHLGHQKIISRLKDVAKENDAETLLITYHPHPRLVLNPDSNIELLTNVEERILLLEKYGLDNLLILPFTKEFSRLTSTEFIRDIIVNAIETHKLVIGYDHQFGRNREGSFEHLKEFGPLYGFGIEEIQAKDIDNVNISSTKIRNALHEGNVEKANTFLGHPYSLSGEVVEGAQIGRDIGFPTANININDKNKLIPLNGVYAVSVLIDGETKKGMLNIGTRPTIDNNNKQSIEVHIFNESRNLYGKHLVVNLIKRIRSEVKFESLDDLQKQLEQDKMTIKNAL